MAEPRFCLSEVWNAEPASADAAEAKRRVLRTIAPENDYSGYECPVEGCVTANYPKNPDRKTAEDTEIEGRVFGPLRDFCRFKDFCLEEAWEVGKDTANEALRKAVRIGAYDYIVQETGLVVGRRGIGSFSCLAAGCELTAGFSEDGVGGTVGTCKRNKEEAPVEPLPVVESRT